MTPFYALITPVECQPPGPGQPPGIWGPTDPRPQPPIANAPGIPGYNPNPPGIWGGGNQPFPTPPIHIPPQPPGIWGGGNQPFPTPPIQLPGQPPYYPAHPIYNPPGIWGPNDPRPQPPINLPGPPLGTWGGAGQPFPTPPIQLPGQPPVYPAHPIYNPPGIWGPNPGFPTNPIVIPPETPGLPSPPISEAPGGTPPAGSEWKQIYVLGLGWVWMLVPVAAPPAGGATPPTDPNAPPTVQPVKK